MDVIEMSQAGHASIKIAIISENLESGLSGEKRTQRHVIVISALAPRAAFVAAAAYSRSIGTMTSTGSSHLNTAEHHRRHRLTLAVGPPKVTASETMRQA
jgi:hypothetical protein